MDEIWKPIKGFEYKYEVSNFGRVKTISHTVNFKDGRSYHVKNKMLNPIMTNRGYKVVAFSDGKKKRQYFVHRLVAEAFIPNPNNYPIINHKDENRSNNIVSNLEWCTYKYNTNYGNCKKKISESEIIPVNAYLMNGDYVGQFNSLTDAANKLNVFVQNISKCCKKKIKYTRGYVFRFTSDIEGNKRENVVTKNRYYNAASHKAKKVIKLTLDNKFIEEYCSIEEAARVNNVRSTGIYACCKGIYKKSGGYKWKYSE